MPTSSAATTVHTEPATVPLIDRTRRIVQLLHGGLAVCLPARRTAAAHDVPRPRSEHSRLDRQPLVVPVPHRLVSLRALADTPLGDADGPHVALTNFTVDPATWTLRHAVAEGHDDGTLWQLAVDLSALDGGLGGPPDPARRRGRTAARTRALPPMPPASLRPDGLRRPARGSPTLRACRLRPALGDADGPARADRARRAAPLDFAVLARSRLQDSDGRDVGTVSDLLVEPGTCRARYLVVDVARLLRSRRTLVAPEWLTSVDPADRRLGVRFPANWVRSGPEYDASVPLDREHETLLHDYYGLTPYWVPASVPVGRTNVRRSAPDRMGLVRLAGRRRFHACIR